MAKGGCVVPGSNPSSREKKSGHYLVLAVKQIDQFLLHLFIHLLLNFGIYCKIYSAIPIIFIYSFFHFKTIFQTFRNGYCCLTMNV